MNDKIEEAYQKVEEKLKKLKELFRVLALMTTESLEELRKNKFEFLAFGVQFYILYECNMLTLCNLKANKRRDFNLENFSLSSYDKFIEYRKKNLNSFNEIKGILDLFISELKAFNILSAGRKEILKEIQKRKTEIIKEEKNILSTIKELMETPLPVDEFNEVDE